MSENNKRKELLNYLISSRNASYNWIFRKEIAAWSAVVLYLTALFAIYNIIKDIKNNSFLIGIEILLIIFSYLFILFLYKQYGSLASEMALHHSLSFWIFNIINNEKVLENFDFTINENDTIPISIRKDVDLRYDEIRKLKVFAKPLLPFLLMKKLLGNYNKKFDGVEIQESIIYDIILLSTLSLLLYIFLKTVGFTI